MGKISRNRFVVKSNELIQSSYSLSLQEARIVLLLASMVNRSDEEFSPYRIEVKEFSDFIGIKNNKNLYHQLSEITKKLLNKQLIVQREKSHLQLNWLASAEYFYEKGFVELEFSKKLKPYLLQLKERFTKYQLENVLRLRSAYSIRLYEISKQWMKLKERKIEISELRYLLGIDENKYKLYGHLKSRVLAPAQKEINKKTDVFLAFSEIKKGKKVVMIRFKMRSQVRKNTAASPPPPKIEKIEKPNLYQRLIDYFLINASDAIDLIEKYSDSRILANLEYVAHQHRGGKIKNIAPYTLKAIREDYRLQKSLFDKEAEDKAQEKQKQAKEKVLQEQLEIKYQQYRHAVIDKYKETISEKDLAEIKKEAAKNFDRQHKPQKGRRRIGKNFFVGVEVEARIAKMAGVPPFETWIKKIDADQTI